MNQGYDVIWYANDKPFFVKPDGTRIYVTVRDYVPYYDVWDGDSAMACPAKGKPQSRPEGQVGGSSASSESSYSSAQTEDAAEEEYTPSIAPLEDPEVHARVVAELLADNPSEVKPNEQAEPIESKDLAGEDVDQKTPRSLAESALRQEAASRKRLMTSQRTHSAKCANAPR